MITIKRDIITIKQDMITIKRENLRNQKLSVVNNVIVSCKF
jgi:hypothetical protein